MKLIKRNHQYIVSPVTLSHADEMLLDMGESLEVQLSIVDKRYMSDQQRKFIFKLCGIVDYEAGLEKEEFRATMMSIFNNLHGKQLQSLTEYSMSDANKLIDLIITFMIEKEIPFDNQLLNDNEFRFNANHTYQMCFKRTCVICGRRADLHHVDHIQFDRKKASHLGKRMLPLCRVHHTEAHTISNEMFIEKYHLTPIVIDEKLEYFIKKGKMKVIE